MIYTGIGSRKTPMAILQWMGQIAHQLASSNWILRSGGADGADNAFERSCTASNGRKEIYLPWKNFNNNKSPLYGVCDKALKIASEIHPAWDKCSQSAKLLHGRNVYQVLGKNLDSPSDLVIAWTPKGECVGGAATALKLAMTHGITIINLGSAYYSDIKMVPHFTYPCNSDAYIDGNRSENI